MSRKYGSLHVRLENGVAAVKQGYIGAMEAVFPVNVAQAAERLGLSLSQEQLPILNRLIQAGLSFRAQPKVVEHLGFVSVYDEKMTFENIQPIAQKLSAILKLSVFFSSVYDDDVFFFGLCENGETVSRHISGDCEAYGMTRENYNIEILGEYISKNEESAPRVQSLSGRDLETALIKALGFQFEGK